MLKKMSGLKITKAGLEVISVLFSFSFFDILFIYYGGLEP